MARRRRANPFRNGPAMLRSARADGWFPKLRETIMRLLKKQFRQSAQLIRELEPDPTPPLLTFTWEEELREVQQNLSRQMANEGFLDAGKEFFQGKTQTGHELWGPYHTPAYQGFQEPPEAAKPGEAEDFVTKEEADLPIIVTEQAIADAEASFLTEARLERIDEHIRQVASAQTRQSASIIQRVFNKATDEGLSPFDIARRIIKEGARLAPKRATMIARTETIWAYNQGAMQRYENLGVTVKEWVITQDDLLCPWCRTMDGVRVTTTDPFWKTGQTLTVVENGKQRKITFGMDILHPPLHPHCRCVLVPVIEQPETILLEA